MGEHFGGVFPGKKVPYTYVKNSIHRMWDKLGLQVFLPTDSGHYFFKFHSKAESEPILEGGRWHVRGRPIILQNWQSGLVLQKDSISRIPIWVNLKYIPLELWTVEGLSIIASRIGKPLHVDRMTASRKRIPYARICIEVNAEYQLIRQFDIEFINAYGSPKIINVAVEYQKIPLRCDKCKSFGHNYLLYTKVKTHSKVPNHAQNLVSKPTKGRMDTS